MGRPCILNQFLNKQIGGIEILRSLEKKNGRHLVECLCLSCKKVFSAQFHNVYRGNYKSCGCLQFTENSRNPRWKGHGEISASFLYALKLGAKRRNLSFQITNEYLWDLFQQQERKCVFTGEILTLPQNRKETQYTASVDRIDASKGYIKGNVQWVHRDVNFSKQQMNNQQFLQLIKKIYEYVSN